MMIGLLEDPPAVESLEDDFPTNAGDGVGRGNDFVAARGAGGVALAFSAAEAFTAAFKMLNVDRAAGAAGAVEVVEALGPPTLTE